MAGIPFIQYMVGNASWIKCDKKRAGGSNVLAVQRKQQDTTRSSILKLITVGPKPATRGGVNGSRSKFLSKFKPSAYIPKITASPPPGVCENSYRQAISQQHTLENFAEAKLKNSPNSNTAESDRSDRQHRPVRPVGLEFKNPDLSDWYQRPVRPVPSRQPAIKASKGKSRANDVQIQRNLEDTFTLVP